MHFPSFFKNFCGVKCRYKYPIQPYKFTTQPYKPTIQYNLYAPI